MRRRDLLATSLALLGTGVSARGQTGRGEAVRPVLRVGPAREVRTLREAARLASAGSLVEVDAGIYRGDTAVWERDGVTLRAVGGRVVLDADGASVEGKGTWVVRAANMVVTGFDFTGSRVPSLNGAGIRLDRGSLRVVGCSFIGNEMGILTGNDPATELDVEDSEFARNLVGDGQSHLLYAGTIARLAVKGSYFHDAKVGHLLKTRAALNVISDNRLTDAEGSASYELEFAVGGIAVVTGNRIQQSALTENPVMVSYAAEGYRWPANVLRMHGNTLIDSLPSGGTFVRVAPGPVEVRISGNRVAGNGRWDVGPGAELVDNATIPAPVAR
ncbi:hypothetical protein [Piscinibacter koreensis]|uniref:Right handed beta helix domain-containing protein n=1 Tax=Piscinibacter koreensis TaxID=2742824 RepID=A0A7Y6NL33_9BURK|nr:hypothetical protein [Schlegelella koreensis]NUZ05176.1 hypothetical protein [Schlegelella koreensis]